MIWSRTQSTGRHSTIWRGIACFGPNMFLNTAKLAPVSHVPWHIVSRCLTQNHKTLVLRPYQEECVSTCLSALHAGKTRIGVSSPTGSGKTTVFTELISRLPAAKGCEGRALILVNGITLAYQAAATARRMLPNVSVEIEQGGKHVASGRADITVATVQSLRGSLRLAKYHPQSFKCVIVDEAHHATSTSYLRVLSHFHRDVYNPDKNSEQSKFQTNIIGFSATFSRNDGVALSAVFEELVYHKDFLDMIKDKWYVVMYHAYTGYAHCVLL